MKTKGCRKERLFININIDLITNKLRVSGSFTSITSENGVVTYNITPEKVDMKYDWNTPVPISTENNVVIRLSLLIDEVYGKNQSYKFMYVPQFYALKEELKELRGPKVELIRKVIDNFMFERSDDIKVYLTSKNSRLYD